jgi:hypothetical protein
MNHIPSEIEKFLLAYGAKGERMLSYMGEHQALIDAINTPLGKQLLKVANDRHQDLVKKVLNSEATSEEVAERKALYEIMVRWSSIISAYYKNLNLLRVYQKEGGSNAQ